MKDSLNFSKYPGLGYYMVFYLPVINDPAVTYAFNELEVTLDAMTYIPLYRFISRSALVIV